MNGALSAMVDYADRFRFDAVPPAVVELSKRLLLDTLGCAAFGYDGDAGRAARATVTALAAGGLSTVIGEELKTLPMLAAVANGVAIRFTEHNDTFLGSAGPIHPSEVVPTALAMGEQVGAGGRQVLEAIVLGYELNARIANTVQLIERGWHHTTMGVLVTPLLAGKLLALSHDQLGQALAISASYGFTTDAMHRGGLSMMRNLAYPLTAYTGILAALLARDGYTGPPEALDGEAGFLAQVEVDPGDLASAFSDHETYFTARTIIKEFACSTISQGPVSAVLGIARREGLRPDDFAAIRVQTFKRAWEVGGDPARRHPDNKESADHSMYYVISAGLLDGDVGPAQFEQSRIESPDVHALIDRITIEWLPELDPQWPPKRPAIIEVTTRDGRHFEERIVNPPGDPDNPLDDEQLRGKFHRLTSRVLTRSGEQSVFDAVMGIDRAPAIASLMDSLRFTPQPVA
jgi:2-methylcitrate dehydratase